MARKIRKSDFKRLTGYDFETICNFIEYVKSEYTKTLSRLSEEQENAFDDIIKSPEFEDDFLYPIYQYMITYTPTVIGDMKRLSSWCIVKRNGKDVPIMIDFGLSDSIYDEYYKK